MTSKTTKDKLSKAQRQLSTSAQSMSLERGQVQTVTKNGILILCSTGAVLAKRAFSCLVEPKVHDIVLCAKDGSNQYSVLAVLERPESQDAVLTFPGNVDVNVSHGDLSFLTEKNIEMTAAEQVKIVSGQVQATTGELNVNSEKTLFQGEEANVTLKTVKSLVDVFEGIGERISHRVKRYLRLTSENDEVRAKNLSRKAEQLYDVRSRHTVMKSKKETKIDGSRIHLA